MLRSLFSEQLFEVATNTKNRDLIKTITSKLGLISDDGFSIFVKTPDKVCAKTVARDYLLVITSDYLSIPWY